MAIRNRLACEDNTFLYQGRDRTMCLRVTSPDAQMIKPADRVLV
jgi:hypothetical protein